MDRSTFLKKEFENDGDAMTAYLSFAGNMKSKIPFSKFLYPSGGLASSVKELTNYLLLYLNNGSFEKKQILNQSLLDEMLKIQIEIPSDFEEGGYGYGWFIDENFYGYKMISHSGGNVVTGAQIRFIPEKNIGIVIACNTANFVELQIIAYLFSLIVVGKDPEKEFPIKDLNQKLEMLTGLYESYKGFMHVEISREFGVLYFKEVPGKRKGGKRRRRRKGVPLFLWNIDNFQFSMPNPYWQTSIFAGGKGTPVKFKVESPQDIYLDLGNTILHKIKPL
jgi:hypothetical protein